MPSNFHDRILKRFRSIPQDDPTDPNRVGGCASTHGEGAAGTMGKSESEQCGPNFSEARPAHHLRRRQEENRCGCAGTVGEVQSGEEECIVPDSSIAFNGQS